MNMLDFLGVDQVVGQSVQTGYVRLSILADLDNILWEDNSKLHKLDQIYQSIVEYGFVDKPHWDSNLNQGKGALVYGNGRAEALVRGLLAAEKEGRARPKGIVEAVDDGEWCIPVGFGMDQESELKAIAFALDHNNLTLVGAREMDALGVAKIWEEEKYLDILTRLNKEDALPVTVDEDDYAYLMKSLRSLEDLGLDPDDLDGAGAGDDYVPRVEEGEIWKLGDHYIACGSCTVESNIDSLLAFADGPVTMVWADPPYGISIVDTGGYVGGGESSNIPFGGVKNETSDQKAKRKGTVGGGLLAKTTKYFPVAGDESIDVAETSTEIYLRRFSEAIHCWWGGNYFAHVLPPSSCWIVWDKEINGNFADAELAWTNQKTAVRIFKHMWNGMIKASEQGQKRVHPTQKPVKLALWFFEKYGSSGDIIVDPFLGSGMSLMAAEEMGDRTVFGLELSNHYCSIVIDRWEKLTGLTAERVGSLAGD